MKRRADAEGAGAADADVDADELAGPAAEKRSRLSSALVAVASSSSSASASASAASASLPRSSSLLEAPSMLLSGHAGAVSAVDFDASGDLLLSASRDQTVLLWRVRSGLDNFALLRGHSNAVLDARWLASDHASAAATRLCSAGADKSVMTWDAHTGQRLRSHAGHSKVVNCVAPCRGRGDVFASGSDDYATRVWDCRARGAAHVFAGSFPVLAAAFAADGNSVFWAGTEGVVRQWDLRRGAASGLALSAASSAGAAGAVMTMADGLGSGTGADAAPASAFLGAKEIITSLALAPDGTSLLAFSADGCLRSWDVRPFAAGGDGARCQALFRGATNNFEMNLVRCGWSGDGERVVCGSADRCVYVWDAASARVAYRLPGHAGVVTGAVFHPSELVVASGGTDKRVWLGELGIVAA